MCRWQRHSVKTFLLKILNDSLAGQKPTRVAVPIEEEEETLLVLYPPIVICLY